MKNMKNFKFLVIIFVVAFALSGCTQRYFGGPGSGDELPYEPEPDGPGSGDELPHEGEPDGPGSGDELPYEPEPDGPGSGDELPYQPEPTQPDGGQAGPGSGDELPYEPEPTGPGSGDEVPNEPEGPGSGDELPYEPEPTGPGSGDEADPNEPTGPGSGDEISQDQKWKNKARGSCNAIGFGSTCVEYIGPFWDTLENASLNCAGAGSYSENPCPRPTVGGCNMGPGTASEIVTWHYNHGGSPYTPDVVPHAARACNALGLANWVLYAP